MAKNNNKSSRLSDLEKENQLLRENAALRAKLGIGGAAVATAATPPLTTAKPLPAFAISKQEVEKNGVKEVRVVVEGHCAVPLKLKPDQFRRLLSKSAEIEEFMKANGL